MSKTLVNKIILYAVIAIIAIGAGFGIWAIVDHYSKKENTDKLVVYTSMYPLYDFVQKIGGNKVEARNIVPNGEEPHHYQGPSAKLVTEMEEADLIVVIGAGMENWLEKLSNNSKIQERLLVTSTRVTLLENDGHSHDDEEDHDHDHEDEEHEHDHDDEDEHGHSHGAYDPHIWLSLTNAKIQVEDIKNALTTIDTENASYYERNYNEYLFTLNGLQTQYDAVLQNVTTTSFVVSHRAFGYIAHEYGLTQISLTSIMSTGDISGSSIQNAINYMKANNIKVIFHTSHEDSQIVRQIATAASTSELTVAVDSLSTIELLTQQDMEMGYDYARLMTKNLAALQDALK